MPFTSHLQFQEQIGQANILRLVTLFAGFHPECTCQIGLPAPVAPVIKRFLCSVMYSQAAGRSIKERFSLRKPGVQLFVRTPSRICQQVHFFIGSEMVLGTDNQSYHYAKNHNVYIKSFSKNILFSQGYSRVLNNFFGIVFFNLGNGIEIFACNI